MGVKMAKPYVVVIVLLYRIRTINALAVKQILKLLIQYLVNQCGKNPPTEAAIVDLQAIAMEHPVGETVKVYPQAWTFALNSGLHVAVFEAHPLSSYQLSKTGNLYRGDHQTQHFYTDGFDGYNFQGTQCTYIFESTCI